MSVKSQKKSTKNGTEKKSLQETLQEVLDLEAGVMNCNTNESMCQTYRLKLCEVLTKLLLSQPSEVLVKHNIAFRLWNHCFYTRIRQLRERIAKELRRDERRVKTQESSNAELVEKIYKVFLNEGIQMYSSLITKFKSSGKVSTAKQATHDSPYKDPTLILLHSFYLRHGDLQRYTTNFNEAQKSYQHAIDLLPGLGEPYNHLGVMSLQKEQPFLSLYFYARSLLASEEPFAVTHQNLWRLLSDSTPSDEYDEPIMITKATFLENFVDLNRLFFAPIFHLRTGKARPVEEACAEEEMEQLVNAIDSLLKNLHFLLKEQQLGESLLIKMIVINIFTIGYLDKCIHGKNYSEVARKNERIGCLPSMALNFAYRFGIVIIGQLKQRLQSLKIATIREEEEKAKPYETTGSRFFPALQLFCDWLFYTDTSRRLANDGIHCVSEQAAIVAYTEQQKFTSSVSLAWNSLIETSEYAASLGTGEKKPSITDKVKFKEHFALRGFEPFTAFVSQEGQNSWVALKSAAEHRARIERLFQYYSRDSNMGNCLLLPSENLIHGDALDHSIQSNVTATMPIEDDDIDDIIVYEAPSSKTLTASPRLETYTAAVGGSTKLWNDEHLQDGVVRGETTSACPATAMRVSPIPQLSVKSECRPPPGLGFAPPGFLRVPQSVDSSYTHFLKPDPFNSFEMLSSSTVTSKVNTLQFVNNASLQGDAQIGVEIGRTLLSNFDSSPWIDPHRFRHGEKERLGDNSHDLKVLDPFGWRSDLGPSVVEMHATSSADSLPFLATGRQHSRLPAANATEFAKPSC